jgi:hypothetical protein
MSQTDYTESNREIIAERMHWPSGAIDDCRSLERDNPQYYVYWSLGILPNQRGPGYYAGYRQDFKRWGGNQTFYGATRAVLHETLTKHAIPDERLKPFATWKPIADSSLRSGGGYGR